MNRSIVLYSLVALFLVACASVPEGHWTANPDQKSSAATTRILNIIDQEYTHLSEDITLFTNLERLIVQNDGLQELP